MDASMYVSKCDIHTHTVASRHAHSTIRENVLEASAMGLEVLGSADHFSSMMVDGCPFEGTANLRDFQYALDYRIWPRTWEGVTVLRGLEADIVDLDGHLFGHGFPVPLTVSGTRYEEVLDLDERCMSTCDYVIASIHGKGFTAGATKSELTRMYIGALQNPKVFTIGHIGRSGLDVDYGAIARAARDLGKCIELNEFSLTARAKVTGERARRAVEACMEAGCGITLSTDAHICCEVGRFKATYELLAQVGFPSELVITRDRATLLGAMERAGIRLR